VKKIKNTRTGDVVRCGQTLAQNVYYEIQALELPRWQNDDTVVAELTSGDLVINDGTSDITGASKIIDFLRDVAGPTTLKPFAVADGFRARFKGVSGTAVAGTTTNIDHVLSEERWIDGVELSQVGAAVGDTVNFQVVHPTYGVVDEFGASWNIDSASCKQGAVVISYPAKLLAGLTIRCAYTSVGEADVWVGVNLRLHKKT
jgi:hypothetical protein